MSATVIRRMTEPDVPLAERLSAESFHELDLRTFQRDWPHPTVRPADRAGGWIRRTRSLLETDAEGCWVAETGDGLVGMATSLVRDKTWCLATYAVRPGLQGHGIGRQLLDAALAYGAARGCLRGMLSASADTKAFRRYRLAGFSMHPQLFLSGRVPREVLPVIDHVRDGTRADLDLVSSVDRQVRGAAHSERDHEALAESSERLLVIDRPAGSGYCYVDAAGCPQLLGATNRRTATSLLWEALAGSDPDEEVLVFHVTPANEWAVDVAMAAGMAVHTSGYLGLRGMRPPAPYLHHGALL